MDIFTFINLLMILFLIWKSQTRIIELENKVKRLEDLHGYGEGGESCIHDCGMHNYDKMGELD